MELLSKPEGGVPKEGNLWYNLGNTVQYPPDPAAPTSFVKQYFFYVYVLGKKAGRDAVVETLFVYYLSVGTLPGCRQSASLMFLRCFVVNLRQKGRLCRQVANPLPTCWL
jgi:hypothetical protein